MKFREILDVHDPGIAEPAELTFTVEQPCKITVILRRAHDEARSWTAESRLERLPKQDVANMFGELAKRLKAHKTGDAKPVPIDEVPKKLLMYSAQIRTDLKFGCARVLNSIRWRLGTLGNHNPIRSLSESKWLADDGDWYELPFQIHAHIDIFNRIAVTKSHEEEFAKIIASGMNEPIAHELLREAWQQRTTNPRSALLVGIAAAEVGAKACIATLQPQTEWLIENLPSPPLEVLLREYFPRLIRGTNSRVLQPFPSGILETIRDGVRMRNQLAHSRPPEIRTESLEDILTTVKDLVWLFDLMCGQTWALQFIRARYRDTFKGLATRT